MTSQRPGNERCFITGPGRLSGLLCSQGSF